MLPSLSRLHIHSTCVEGTTNGAYDVVQGLRLRPAGEGGWGRVNRVTIDHVRKDGPDARKNSGNSAGSFEPVYGRLLIVVQPYTEDKSKVDRVTVHSSRDLQKVIATNYDTASQLVEEQDDEANRVTREMFERRPREYRPEEYVRPLDKFVYKEEFIVAIPEGDPNLQPQQFFQRDYGRGLHFMREVVREAIGNLVIGKSLMETRAPYSGSAQDPEEPGRVLEDILTRAQNMDPQTFG